MREVSAIAGNVEAINMINIIIIRIVSPNERGAADLQPVEIFFLIFYFCSSNINKQFFCQAFCFKYSLK